MLRIGFRRVIMGSVDWLKGEEFVLRENSCFYIIHGLGYDA